MKNSKSYISASQVNLFLQCPLAYKLSYIDKLFEDSGNVYASYGTAIHEALAHNYRQKIKTKQDLFPEEIIKIFIDSFESAIESCVINPYDNIDSLKLIGQNVLEQYMSTEAPNIQPIAVEQKFELELKTRPVKILGYIDLIDDKGFIHDYKTVGKSQLKKWTQKEVDSLIQLTFYAIAYRKLYNKKEAGLIIDILPRDNRPNFSSFLTQRTEDEIFSVIDLAYRIQEIKKLDIWYPNLNQCKDCFYNKVCPKKIT